MWINKKNAVLTVLMVSSLSVFAQGLDNDNITQIILRKEISERSRPIQTAVPLLLISPDARSGAMGDIGAATTPDANSNHWNAAKFPFITKKTGMEFTYSPWMRNIIDGINLAYLSGFYKLNDRSALGASLTYFSLGGIDFTDDYGQSKGTYNPNEFAVDMSYSMKLSENLAASVTGRYIRSDLTQGQMVGTTETHAGNAGAVDLGIYYQKDIAGDRPQQYAWGVQISNLGNKISYSNNVDASFLPANLRVGGRYSFDLDMFNKISVMLDANKLLVPSPDVWSEEDGTIHTGYKENIGVVSGVFQSFYDAPDGFKEEFNEISWSLGAEYWYNNIFAFRGGYFYESKKKGNRQYLTFGVGIKYNSFGVNLSYLIPTSSQQGTNPLGNTLRVSLAFDM